jgi:ATP/maltotriose-dependent transcriptional regulator MalT
VGDETDETGESLEALARDVYAKADYRGAMDIYEQAYTAYRNEGDLLAAARCARTAGWMHGWLFGEYAVFGGWMSRASAILEEYDADTAEHGWVLNMQARYGNDLAEQKRDYLAARDIGRAYGDVALEAESLNGLGTMLVLSGHTDEGFRYLDEALGAVCSGDVRDVFVVESTFCGLFASCERTHDVDRAQQWMRAADDLAKRFNFLPVAGYCRAHYGGLLTAAGRWTEAEKELNAAARVFSLDYIRIYGNVVCRLADLHIRQGRLEEAAQLLEGLEQHDDAVFPLAALHLAHGRIALARDLLERTIERGDHVDSYEGPLLALLVDVHIAAGDTDKAQAVTERLTQLAGGETGFYLRGIAALARGKVCVASGTGDARRCLDQALSTFAEGQLPFDVARARLELAKAVAADDPEVAVNEATAALNAFAGFAATRDADAAAALLRSLGSSGRPTPRSRDVLTRRENEVLDLLGHGLSNAQIGERLFISPKTVEHHVGRIFTKLGVRGRAEAVALAGRLPSGHN